MNRRIKNTFRLTALSMMIALSGTASVFAADQSSSQSRTVPGQVIDDGSGNPFMEEVIDEKKWQDEEAARKKQSNLERRRLSDEELRNVGMQVTESGHLIPLINKGAPPVRQMGSQFTSSFEPIYPAYVVVPNQPAPYVPPVPYNPFFMNPMTYGNPLYGGMGFGMPFGSPFMNPFFGNPWMNRFMYPYGSPYMMPPYAPSLYNTPSIIIPPSYSYTWQSIPGSSPPAPSSFTTSGSYTTSPFWNSFNGGNSLLNIPTTHQFSNTTTFTPIPPATPSP